MINNGINKLSINFVILILLKSVFKIIFYIVPKRNVNGAKIIIFYNLLFY